MGWSIDALLEAPAEGAAFEGTAGGALYPAELVIEDPPKRLVLPVEAVDAPKRLVLPVEPRTVAGDGNQTDLTGRNVHVAREWEVIPSLCIEDDRPPN